MVRSLRAAAAVVLLATVAHAHGDDPKILDKQPPYVGPGYRQALVGRPGLAGLLPGGRPGAALPGGRLATPRFVSGGQDEQGNALAVLGPETSFAPGIDFASDEVQLLAWLPLDAFGAGTVSGNDCWGYVSPGGREYALIGTSHATAFVDVTQPDDPVVVAVEPGPQSLWRDVKTYQTYAYSVSEGGGGIQVFDLSSIDSGVVTHLGDFDNDGTTTTTHNVLIDETSGFLYRAGGSSHGLRIYSLANPANPTFVNSWDDRYVHDAQVVTYTSGPQAGKQIAYCASGDFATPRLDILDVTNKNNIVVMDQFFYPNPVYSHQVWVDPDTQLLYLNDELDENGVLPTTTYVIDVSNPNNATLAGAFDNGNPAVGHNVYVKDGLLYEANYRSGLRVFDLQANPTDPPEVAWFDVYPQDDADEFNGLWSVYPFLPSGTIIGSDLEKGLFVWRLGPPAITLTPTAALPALIPPEGFTLEAVLAQPVAGSYVPGSAQLHYDAGKGWKSVSMQDVGGGTFRATLPPVPCGLEVPYYISALANDGVTWTTPSVAAGLTWLGQVADGRSTALLQDMEADQGWVAGVAGDDASTGIWERGDPIGTGANPEDDHTAGGSDCWFTGQGSPGGSLGENDVDGGTTTLLSPVYDLTGLTEPNIAYWRWYVNAPAGAGDADDVFLADISDDGGQSWVNVETLDPTVHEQVGAWIRTSFRVADYVEPTATVRMRFVASDLGNGSIVEAGIDDFEVLEVQCPDCDGDGEADGMEILAGGADLDFNGVPDECVPPDFGGFGGGRPTRRGGPPGGVGGAPPSGPAPVLGQVTPPPFLSSVVPTLSVSTGGEHVLRIEAGEEHAGKPYLLLGSVSGTEPGFALPTAVVPLRFDAYTQHALVAPDAPPLRASRGVLDEAGHALAAFALPAGSDPALVGLTVHHAYLVFEDVVAADDVVLVSNATTLLLVE